MVLKVVRGKRETIKRALRKGKRAFTLIEMMLVLVGGATLIAIGFLVFKKLVAYLDTQKAMSNVQAIMNYVENVKAQSGGVYPAVDTETPMNQIDAFSYLAKTVPDIKYNTNYKYSCVEDEATGKGTLTLKIPLKDEEMCKSVASMLKTKYATFNSGEELKYDFTCSGNILQIQKTGTQVICQSSE